MNWQFYISIGICVMLLGVVISTFATLVPKDSAQNTKLLAVISTFSFAACIVGYALALYHFSHNPAMMIQFTLGVVMLVALPASLIATSISTVTISNLRDNLAASG